MYYVIADLHGRFDLLESALNLIDADDPDHEGQIITLGDYIDRGRNSKAVIDQLMARPDIMALKGNHEAMAVETIVKPLNADWWMGNGGFQTIKSYNEDAYYGEVSWVNQDHVKWMASLPIFYETPKQVFVHAGIPYLDAPLEDQDEEKMIWMLYGKNESGGWKGKHVVHGHHQFEDGPHTYFGKDGGRTDLDTFAWYTGRLAIGVFDDTQGPPIQILEVTDAGHTGTRNIS